MPRVKQFHLYERRGESLPTSSLALTAALDFLFIGTTFFLKKMPHIKQLQLYRRRG